MDITLRELECFTAAAEELSFTRGAEKLGLAQPPLSRHIRMLEEKVGATLFERRGRRVTLTAAGALFHGQTRSLLPALARSAEAARQHATGANETLRLGFVSAVLGPELMDTLQRFRKQHPTVQLMVEDSPPSVQMELLRRGLLEGGFVGLRPQGSSPGIVFTPWRKEPLAVFVPFDHPLARQESVPLAQLRNETFVAVSSEAAPAFSAFVRRICGDQGFRPRIVLEADRAQAVAVMVTAGAGIALLPVSLARVVGDAVRMIPLRKAPLLTHVFARAAGPSSPAMSRFLTFIQ